VVASSDHRGYVRFRESSQTVHFMNSNSSGLSHFNFVALRVSHSSGFGDFSVVSPALPRSLFMKSTLLK